MLHSHSKIFVQYVNSDFTLCFSLQIRTVKVSNVSSRASEQDMKEFFSFSGQIAHVEMRGLVFVIEVDKNLHFSYAWWPKR